MAVSVDLAAAGGARGGWTGLRSEFGAVELRVDDGGLGPLLEVRCLRSERLVRLDPLVLSALAQLGIDAVLDSVVRPVVTHEP